VVLVKAPLPSVPLCTVSWMMLTSFTKLAARTWAAAEALSSATASRENATVGGEDIRMARTF
jgi:hypothetical protein